MPEVLSSHFGILRRDTFTCLSPHCVPPKRNERRPGTASGTLPEAWLVGLRGGPGGLAATFDRAVRRGWSAALLLPHGPLWLAWCDRAHCVIAARCSCHGPLLIC